jgi:hypothetical protein
VAWDGRALLVVYNTPAPPVLRAPLASRLAAVGLDGVVRWRDRLVGVNRARIAWNPALHVGLVVTDRGLVWLGGDGHPLPPVTPLPASPGVDLAAAPAETADGFVVLTGISGHAGPLPPLTFGRVGPTPGAVTWRALDGAGVRATPVRARAVSGLATWMASSSWEGGVGDLFPIAPGVGLGAPVHLGEAIPPQAHIVALAEDGKELLAVYVVRSSRELYAVTVASRASSPRRLDARGARSASADLVRVGGTLVLGADQIGADQAVAAAALDPDRPGLLGPPLRIGEPGSQAIRFAPTPRGFAAVWNMATEEAPELVPAANGAPATHSLSTLLAVYDCCPG